MRSFFGVGSRGGATARNLKCIPGTRQSRVEDQTGNKQVENLNQWVVMGCEILFIVGRNYIQVLDTLSEAESKLPMLGLMIRKTSISFAS